MKPLAVVFTGLLVVMPLMTAHAADESLQISGRMLFRMPELARPGSCVMYREGGAGWILTEPQYWLKGTVILAGPRKIRSEVCPLVPGKAVEQYSREEFNRLAQAQPCVARPQDRKDVEYGFIRFKVEDWETPWGKASANAGRLFQGHYLDYRLHKGMELELPADLLLPCP